MTNDLGPLETGYDVVLWMEENDVWPARGVFVHSSNTSAKEKMLLAIDRKYPELVRFRKPMATPFEQAALNDWVIDKFEGL